MQVRELQSIETLHSFQLLAGGAGLDRPMKDVVLLEYESLKQKDPKYYEEDFIVSTLSYAKDDPKLLLSIVERLIGLDAAGLAFKSVYYTALPEDVLALAEAHSFPIFIFDELYMEDVILRISDYIRLRQEFSMFDEPLYAILTGESGAGEIPQLCSRMNPGRMKYMCGIYIHAPQPESTWSLTLRDALGLRAARDITGDWRFLQFRRGFFAIFNSNRPIRPEEIAAQCRDILGKLGALEEGLCFGVSRVHEHSADFDRVIRESFDALTAAMVRKTPLLCFADLSCCHMIFPVLRDKSARVSNEELLERLRHYDRDSGSGSLLPTLQTYARTGYDIPATAKALGQHPNTIRYRLKKIGELLGAPHFAGEAMFLLGEYMRLDAMRQMIF